MTFSAPSCDFYDDGLVHSHNWASNTPPGGAHNEKSRDPQKKHDHDDGLVHDHRWARS